MQQKNTRYLVLKTETDIPASQCLCLTVADLDGCPLISAGSPRGITVRAAAHALRDLLKEEPETVIVSHSDYHRNVLANFLGVVIQNNQFVDTLKTAEMLRGKGGNSLDNLASLVNMERLPIDKKHEYWTIALANRCDHDAKIVGRLWQKFLKEFK